MNSDQPMTIGPTTGGIFQAPIDLLVFGYMSNDFDESIEEQSPRGGNPMKAKHFGQQPLIRGNADGSQVYESL
jgi:hypothetical protein